jgi:hypothetical protein
MVIVEFSAARALSRTMAAEVSATICQTQGNIQGLGNLPELFQYRLGIVRYGVVEETQL